MIEEASEEAGMQIPLAELGGSLAAEYKVAVIEDQSLEKWRVNADQHVNGFKWDQGLLKKLVEDVIKRNKEVLAVPVCFRHRILQLVHDQLGHDETGKMLWALKRHCTWPGMSGTVKAYVKGCMECQRMRKGSAWKIPMGEMPIYDVPFNNVAIDIVGPFPRAKVLSSCYIHLPCLQIPRGHTHEKCYSCRVCRVPDGDHLQEWYTQDNTE